VNINTENKDGVAALRFEGNLDTNTSPQAQEALTAACDASEKVLVNFKDLDYVSSAGLRVLLIAAKKLKKTGGQMHICSLNETVNEVFEISGFSSIFSVFGDEDEALAAFN
jgi:anti-sigma B factor antagonist/stage II sporulation protein AA (anti-sigma F factor antagonist)